MGGSVKGILHAILDSFRYFTECALRCVLEAGWSNLHSSWAEVRKPDPISVIQVPPASTTNSGIEVDTRMSGKYRKEV
jgi:hypothetical protein